MNPARLESNDRRRAPRDPAADGQTVPLRASHSVRVLDVGLGGALVASRHPMPMGARGTLTFALGSAQLHLEVEVRRVDYSDPFIYHIGTAFVGMTEEQRETLLQLVQR